MHERLVDQVRRSDRLILSVHIPKTAGSRFHAALKARYGRAFAVYYGADDKRTHPLARRHPRDFDAAMIRDLERAGVRILHGHFTVPRMAGAVDDPSRYWVWLREPIERTISHYHFVKKRAAISDNVFGEAIAAGEDIATFAARPRIAAFQSHYAEAFPLADYGFVGISEMFVDLIAREGLADAPGASNTNRDKPFATAAERRALTTALAPDIGFYSEAMARTVARLGAAAPRRAGLAARLLGR
ncbi:Sulfotransferase family protein [Stappia sp. 22II-S9-Z10]|nr:Sulfotransferase family protein [Stappia sp. 22II-S9-Z10]